MQGSQHSPNNYYKNNLIENQTLIAHVFNTLSLEGSFKILKIRHFINLINPPKTNKNIISCKIRRPINMPHIRIV